MGAAKSQNKRTKSPVSKERPVSCVCGSSKDEKYNDESWIACESCNCLQHVACMSTGTEGSEQQCDECAPTSHKMPHGVSARGLKRREDESEVHLMEPAKGETPQRQEKKKRRKGEKSDRDTSAYDHVPDNTDEAVLDGNSHVTTLFPLTAECHHYSSISEVPWDIQKYWHQRHSIFSCYNEGIYMTDDAWFGVTPEPVANAVADDLATFIEPSKTVLIDLFGGVGGNAIAFALSGRWTQVIAVEKDPSVLACGQHNASLYGVADQITWINDDCFSYLESNKSLIDPAQTAIFASPPWGGPGYVSDEIFNLNTMSPYSLKEIYEACRGMGCGLYLPRTSDLRQIARLAPKGEKIEAVQYCMQGASKALVAYVPPSPMASL